MDSLILRSKFMAFQALPWQLLHAAAINLTDPAASEIWMAANWVDDQGYTRAHDAGVLTWLDWLECYRPWSSMMRCWLDCDRDMMLTKLTWREDY